MRAADVIANLELNDVLTFGKYRGKTVEAVYKEDSGYLVWLREERRIKNMQNNFFSQEVNTLLDMTIGESKSLKKKYKTWKELGLYDGAAPAKQTSAVPPEPALEPSVAYEVWGSF